MHLRKILLAAFLLIGSPMLLADVFYNDCCTPCYNQCGNECFEFAFWFDPMAVKPCQIDLIAFTIIQTVETDEGFGFLDRSISFDPDWSFGFRIGGGVKPQCGAWSFRADYTYWNNSTSFTDITPLMSGALESLSSVETLPETVLQTCDELRFDGKLKYNYNLLDVTAGWSCCICNGLELTPYGGFRGLWYTTDANQDVDSPTSTQMVHIRNDYHAYGVVGGLRFNYNFWSCLNFYGSFGGSLIAGDNDFKNDSIFTLLEDTILEFRRETRCHYIHSIEGAWGITYDTCLCGIDAHLGLGYEITQWNTILPNTLSAEGADLSSNGEGLFIQAITARIGVAF